MKIGIMSMQRVENYGSFLQAYGLKKEIEKQFVQIIDSAKSSGIKLDELHKLLDLLYEEE